MAPLGTETRGRIEFSAIVRNAALRYRPPTRRRARPWQTPILPDASTFDVARAFIANHWKTPE